MMSLLTNHLLVYGKGGLGKSTIVAQLAEHVYRSTGKKTRVVGADGGGFKAFEHLMQEGIVQYWPIDQWDEMSPFYTTEFAAKGFWPEDIGTPNSILLAPKEEWRECSKCLGDCGAKGVAMVEKCAKCGEKFGQGVRLPKRMRLINGMEDIGAVAFEGLTAIGAMLMNRLRSTDTGGGRSIKDEGYTISAPGQQHYGDAQAHLQQMAVDVRKIPVPIVLWTALELRGNDDGYGKPIYGPALPGKKLTALCIPWFTDVIHLEGESAGKDPKGVDLIKRVLYLSEHFPADTKPFGFAAKSSVPLGGEMPLVIPFDPAQNVMTTFFTEMEKAKERLRVRITA